MDEKEIRTSTVNDVEPSVYEDHSNAVENETDANYKMVSMPIMPIDDSMPADGMTTDEKIDRIIEVLGTITDSVTATMSISRANALKMQVKELEEL